MKGTFKIKKTIVEEATNILKQLSPKNQAHFMELLRVAFNAENGVRKDIEKQSNKRIENRSA